MQGEEMGFASCVYPPAIPQLFCSTDHHPLPSLSPQSQALGAEVLREHTWNGSQPGQPRQPGAGTALSPQDDSCKGSP